jgi:hypothetical protein
LLTRHGSSWRDDHLDSPTVDWDRVVTSSRTRVWGALGAIAAVVVVAVAVPVMIASGSHQSATPGPGPSPHASDVRYGSPHRYFGLKGGGVQQVSATYRDVRRESTPVVAIGGNQQGVTLYDVRSAPSCRSAVDVTSYLPGDLVRGRGIALAGQPRRFATLAGGPAATPIAVSEPAGELAMVVAPSSPSHSAGSRQLCTGPQQIVFVNLSDGSVVGRESLLDNRLQIDSLAWSADGQQLVYRLEPNNFSDGYGPPNSDVFATSGSHVLDIHGAPHQLENTPKLLPLAAPHAGGRYGPIFWWRGGWAATFNGTLYRLDDRGGLGERLASDFPNQVDTVSVDPTEEHLLIGSGSASYRWDYNRLSPLPEHFSQPTW